jgi:hypothetical protein
MSDSATKTDGAWHNGQGEVVPTETSATPLPHEIPDPIKEQGLERRVSDSVRRPLHSAARDMRWVRASDVLSAASAQASAHAIRLTHAVHRPAQALTPAPWRKRETGQRIWSDRASRLAPLGAFGVSRGVRGSAMSLHR